MSTIYLNDTSKPIRPPHSNDCNGHNTSISVGGNGHWVGDGCQCDDINPETPIDFIAPLLILLRKKIKLWKQNKKLKELSEEDFINHWENIFK